MNIAIVGCGFVFDIYMRTILAHPEINVKGVYDLNEERTRCVHQYYGFSVYNTYDELLADSNVDTVVNLTSIGSHFEVSKRALEAGKHVYSEKPLTKRLEESAELFELARQHRVRLYAAPCNIFSDTVRTIFKLVRDGAIGKPVLIYAELDDSPIHLMGFEGVKSPTGAPWPLEEELKEGCTYEHLGYHLVWICGLLGPATSVTAFSSELTENKTASLPSKVGTPDYSVACLNFVNGATARITCSFVAPRDHRLRVIGREGEVVSDSYRHYRSPVYLERYSKLSLNARKFRTLRAHPILGRLFGIGGHKVELVRNWKSVAVEKGQQTRLSFRRKVIEWVRRREIYAQDKFAGIAEMAEDLRRGRPQYLTPDFIMHISELTLLVHGAGPEGLAVRPHTTFEPLGPIPGTMSRVASYHSIARLGILERIKNLVGGF